MKKYLLIFLLICILVSSTTVYAQGKSNEITLLANPTASTVLVNNQPVKFDAYNINSNNYFKLRDIGEALEFNVDWDSARNTIVIDTERLTLTLANGNSIAIG